MLAEQPVAEAKKNETGKSVVTLKKVGPTKTEVKPESKPVTTKQVTKTKSIVKLEK